MPPAVGVHPGIPVGVASGGCRRPSTTGRSPTGRSPTGRSPTGRSPTGPSPTGPSPTGRRPEAVPARRLPERLAVRQARAWSRWAEVTASRPA